MAENRNGKLKIHTVYGNGESAFSPEEMQPTEVAEALESDLAFGKTEKQVRKARRMFGTNDIRSDFALSFRDSLKNQFRGMTGIFLALCSAMMFAFEPQRYVYLVTAIASLMIIILNAFLAYRANLALRLPKRYSSLKAQVIRNGAPFVTDSRGLVPGDLILLEEGVMVPADCRIVDDIGLEVMETHVSGAEAPAKKDGRYIARGGPESVCANMVYAGSIVTSGHCTAIVCRTGRDTLTRRISDNGKAYIPGILLGVQKLSKLLSVSSAAACFALLMVGIMTGSDITESFIPALLITASSLCDGLVSLCSSSLGFGVRKTAEYGIIIKNYSKISDLAQVDTIMCGKNLAFPPKRIALTGMYFSGRNYDREKRPDEDALELLTLMLACSDARKVTAAEKKLRHGMPEYIGTPTDNAIVDYFGEWGKTIGDIGDRYIRMDAEYAISGEVSRIMALRGGKNTVILRGSPENVLSRCVGYSLDGTDYKLSDFTRKKILNAVLDSSRTNAILQAVAVGETEATALRDIDSEQRLIFKGFVSFSSSLDPGVAEAVYNCEAAGIETVVSSTDAYYPALNSAKSAGIITDESQIITATQLRSCSRGLVIANTPYYRLFLNIDDDEWLDVLNIRRENGKTVLASAERLTELPLMKHSDVSVVPEDSCDTLRQSADMLMLGSGINLLADGIRGAKTVCRRIRSVAAYIFSGMVMMFLAQILGVSVFGTPVFRAQDVLFGGLICNAAFAAALAFEPQNIKNLREKHSPRQSRVILLYSLVFSVLAGVMLFCCFAVTHSYTCSLIALTLTLFLHAGSVCECDGVIAQKRFGSRLLWLCGLCAAVLIAALIFTKPGHSIFGYGVPVPANLLVSLAFAVFFVLPAQILLFFVLRRRAKKPAGAITEERSDNDEDNG